MAPGRLALVEGEVEAVAGDTLRIGGTIAHFDDIVTPKVDQKCTDNKGAIWACGHAAKLALAEIIEGKLLNCSLTRIRLLVPFIWCAIGGERDLFPSTEMAKRGLATLRRGAVDRTSNVCMAVKTAREEHIGIWAGYFEMPLEGEVSCWE